MTDYPITADSIIAAQKATIAELQEIIQHICHEAIEQEDRMVRLLDEQDRLISRLLLKLDGKREAEK